MLGVRNGIINNDVWHVAKFELKEVDYEDA